MDTPPLLLNEFDIVGGRGVVGVGRGRVGIFEPGPTEALRRLHPVQVVSRNGLSEYGAVLRGTQRVGDGYGQGGGSMLSHRLHHASNLLGRHEGTSRIVHENGLNRSGHGPKGMPNGRLSRLSSTYDCRQLAQPFGLEPVAHAGHLVLGNRNDQVPDVGVLFEKEEHLYQKRSVAQGAKLLPRSPKAPPLPGRRDENGHLVRAPRVNGVRHGVRRTLWDRVDGYSMSIASPKEKKRYFSSMAFSYTSNVKS